MVDAACIRIEFLMLQLLDGLQKRPRRLALTVPGETVKGKKVVLSFQDSRTRRSLCCVVRVLALLYQRASKCSTTTGMTSMTKRAVFYADKALFRDQKQSDRALERASLLLGLDRSALHVFASPRGFFVGDLALELDDGTTISSSDDHCGSEGEVAIHEDWRGRIHRMRSSALCIVVVEKYSFFHNFVKNSIVQSNLSRCIFVTSCGYPVRAVCDLLSVLHSTLHLPCFVLVDFDPYGIDIFLKYCQAVPEALLVGLLAEDVAQLPQKCTLRMTSGDAARGASMLSNVTDPACIQALRYMMQNNIKLELEAMHLSDELLTRVVKRISTLTADAHNVIWSANCFGASECASVATLM